VPLISCCPRLEAAWDSFLVTGRVGVMPEVFGRESELSMLRGFVAADRPRGALL
jgi:hypothetical protein